MNNLFGSELPTSVNFVIAFIVVLVLIGAATWLVRRFGATRTDAAGRARQPRLAVVDVASIDSRRKLVIIRRDNSEHLVMIGGPTDVVVETNIVRSGTAGREAPTARAGAGEAPPRAMPLPDANGGWQAQPEPAPVVAPAAAPVVRLERPPRVVVEETPQWPEPSEPLVVAAPPPPAPAATLRPARPADTLAGLAAELSRPAPEVVAIPRITQPEPTRAAAPPVAPPPTVELPTPAAEQNLAEMAQRLEAALRRPVTQAPVRPAEPAARKIPELKPIPRPEPRVAAAPLRPGEAPAPKAPPKNIEQEMATLLGRPGKT